MSFKAGDIAVLKTTGEKVMVLSSMTYPGAPGDSLSVRRPVATRDNGLVHVDNVFFDFELETFEQQLNREVAEAKIIDNLRAKMQADTQPAAKSPLVN